MAPERLSSDFELPPEHQEAAEFQYHLLTGHYRTDKTSWKSTEQLHSEYLQLTDKLIYQATNGAEVVDPATGETVIEKPDYIVWLDKSARPVSWLMRDAWPLLAADKTGNVPQMPQFRYVNIDRKQWTSSIDPSGQGRTDVSAIDKSIIRGLRSIFLADPNDRKNGLTEEIDAAPTQFDGKTVLIVDELRTTGRTLVYAQRFFRRAFPTAKVGGAYWMEGMTTINNGLTEANADTPVWYSDTVETGRGVGGRNIDLSLKSENPTQRLGAWFLSVALYKPDPSSRMLREELHQLVEDAKDGKVFIKLSDKREDADFDERALRLNHLKSMQEYRVKNEALMHSR